MLADPLRPFAGAVGLEDVDYRVFARQGECPSTFASMSHPPLVPYAIALVAGTAGGFRERWLHLGFVPFALGAALAMYSLARRFTQHALFATLLLVSSPIYSLSAQSLMTDMPSLALGAGGLALLVQGIDEDRRSKVVLAGLLAGLAGVTRYSALLSVPLLLAYGLSRGRLGKALPALAGVALVLGAWSAQNLFFHGELHILASARHYRLFYQGQSFDWTGLVKKALADFSGLGGTAFAAAGLLLLADVRRGALYFGAGALSTLGVFALRPAGLERLATYSSLEAVAVAACVGCGVLLLAEAIRRDGRADAAPDRSFLLLWLSLALAGSLLLLPFGTARYMLAVLPPMWLLLVRRVESMPLPVRALRPALALAIGQGLVLGGMLGLADADLAGRYRDVARSVRESHPGRSLWFVGEWGFRHYMQEAGARYLRSTDEAPRTGDIIVRPSIAGMHEMSPDVRRRSTRLQEVPLLGRWPVRVMSFEAHAGYYSHHWGYLPWAFSRTPLERIEVFEVRAPAPRIEADPCESS